MGTHNSTLVRKNRIGSEWVPIGSRPHCTIVRHQYSGRVADCYMIGLDPHLNPMSELEIYNYRRLQNEGLVQVYGAEMVSLQSPSFCGLEQTIKVLTETIPERLSTLPQLSFAQCLFVLLQSLPGFYQIFCRLGVIELFENLICFTSEGHVKVWLNDNLAVNHPKNSPNVLDITAYQYDISNERRSQAQMVRNLMNLVEIKCEEGRYPQHFRTELFGEQHMGFQTAQRLILNYIKFNQMQIIDNINLEEVKKYTAPGLTEPSSKIKQENRQSKTEYKSLASRFVLQK